MSQALYSKFRADLLEWCRFYRAYSANECPTVGRVAHRAIRRQMAHLRQSYFVGNITY
jgi:hypothetical protein